MNIIVPDLNYKNAMKFCYELNNRSLSEGEQCVVDFSNVTNCDPFPMLLVSGAIRRFRSKYKANEFKACNCENSYANHI